jgi:hypothetical protein
MGLWVAPDARSAWAVADSGVVGRWNGTNWWEQVTMPRNVALAGVWGSAAGDVWMAGAAGTLFHWNGAQVTESSAGIDDFLAIGGTAADDVWAVGKGGSIARYNGTTWTPLTRRISQGVYWNRLVVAAQDDAWLFGSEGGVPRAMRWDGQGWNNAAAPSDGEVIGFAACADDVWVLGPSGHQHWDGMRWTLYPVDFSVGSLAMHGTGPSDIWSVGQFGVLNHYDGERWSYHGLMSYTLHDVFGVAPNRYWAVGYTGVVAQYDGIAWNFVTPQPSDKTLHGVWASGPDDVWAVGEGGTIVHFDGTAWTTDNTSAPGVNFEDVWGTGPHDVWAVGWGSGAVFHFDGTRWNEKSAGTGSVLTAVAGSGNTLWLFAGEYDGQKLLRRWP